MAKHNKRFLLTPSRVVFYVFAVLVFYLAIKYIAKLENIRALLLQIRTSCLFIVVALQAITYMFNALILQILLQADKSK